jgi:DNA-binding winged helix-turn-helix (wHTH) protein/TolB-like protein/Tfp pilus assembly protein PilF
MRQGRRLANKNKDLSHQPPFQLGDLHVEPALLEVRRGAETRRIEPKVMQVLIHLLRRDGAIVSREELREHCWTGRTVGEDALDRVIGRLRRLSEEIASGSFTIETVPRVGYRLQRAEPDDPGARAASPAATGWSRRTMIAAGGGAALVGAGALVLWPRFSSDGSRPAEGAPITMAVLPFRVITDTPAFQSLARQLASELRSDLSRMVDLRVIAETSSSAAASEQRTARQLGRRLGASLLLEGEVSGTAVESEVRVNLVRSADESQVWTESVRAPLSDIAALRNALSGAVLQHVVGLLPPTAAGRQPPLPRPDPHAYALVSEANRLLEEIRTSSMRGRQADAFAMGDRAEQLARRALVVDARSASAMLVLATLARNGWTNAEASMTLTTEQRVERSVAIIRQALVADPNNPGALTQLGDFYRRYAFRWDEAENLFRRALQLNPSLVEAHWSYGYMLGTTGRSLEGLDHALSVFQLDPRNPFRRIALPRLLYTAGQRAAALRRYDVELREQPDNLFLLRELYFMFLSEGDRVQLAALGERIRRAPGASVEIQLLLDRIAAGVESLSGRPTRLAAMANADRATLDAPAALRNATPQGRARDDLPYILAIEFAWANEPEASLNMLERALVAKSLYWPATLPFGNAPFPPSVRNHPRYPSLWRQDPGLRELLARRRRALMDGQMAGVGPDRILRVPPLPLALAQRVRSALAQT